MKLLTDAERKDLPDIFAQDGEWEDAVAHVKLFMTDAYWTLYVLEFDGEDRLYGLAVTKDVKLSYFSLANLQEMRGPYGLPVERDMLFSPRPLGELPAWEKQIAPQLEGSR